MAWALHLCCLVLASSSCVEPARLGTFNSEVKVTLAIARVFTMSRCRYGFNVLLSGDVVDLCDRRGMKVSAWVRSAGSSVGL